jgi:hypothetical protein
MSPSALAAGDGGAICFRAPAQEGRGGGDLRFLLLGSALTCGGSLARALPCADLLRQHVPERPHLPPAGKLSKEEALAKKREEELNAQDEAAAEYSSKDLDGLTVTHNAADIAAGETVIMTLKDSTVLSERDGDVEVRACFRIPPLGSGWSRSAFWMI